MLQQKPACRRTWRWLVIKGWAVLDSVAKPPTTRELTTLLGESYAAFGGVSKNLHPAVCQALR
jgi:hypothetical protein